MPAHSYMDNRHIKHRSTTNSIIFTYNNFRLNSPCIGCRIATRITHVDAIPISNVVAILCHANGIIMRRLRIGANTGHGAFAHDTERVLN